MPTETITLPLADVRALVDLGWQLTEHIARTDTSATGSIYGIEHAHKTIARVSSMLPRHPPHPFRPHSAHRMKTDTPTPRTDAALKKTQGLFRAAAAANGFADFARQLERELAASTSKLAKLEPLIGKVARLERELDEANDQLRLARLQLRAYSVNPDRISNTEIAMARVAQDQFSALRDKLAASEQARRELVEALETAIRDCDSYGWEISEDTYDAMRETLAKHAQNGGDK